MTSSCSEERFLKDVAEHQMILLRDNGLDRHLRFKAPGTSAYYFDLVTWSGHLCITGDCGSYLFSRIEDMFEFFRTHPRDLAYRSDRKLHINVGYWGEKVIAADRNGGLTTFSEETFKSAVVRAFRSSWRDRDYAARRECWGEVREQLLDASFTDEREAFDAVYHFEHEGFTFTDFWDYTIVEPSFHFVWCLYGIAWGIQQYDALKAGQEQAA